MATELNTTYVPREGDRVHVAPGYEMRTRALTYMDAWANTTCIVQRTSQRDALLETDSGGEVWIHFSRLSPVGV